MYNLPVEISYLYLISEAEGVIDSTDITATDIIKNIDPNMDDIFVVSSYKKTGGETFGG